MSENEQRTLKKLSENISKMPDSKKEYILGLADGIALMTEPEELKSPARSLQEV